MNSPGQGGFKDHFSGHSDLYAAHRPGYPPELFAWLESQTDGHGLAWDVGTGNGQAAVQLAAYYAAVHATDASEDQVSNARIHKGVHYRVETAEQCSLPNHSADLVTVGQALHWFDFERFYPEVKRVLKPGGLFAAWTYQLNIIDPEIDAVIRKLFEELVGPWWPPERKHVENAYRDLPFPFGEISAPELVMQIRMDLPAYQAYLRTWSAVQRFMRETNRDPVEAVCDDLVRAWGSPETARSVSWPLVIRAGLRKS